jgi:hypothetical protein
MEEVYDHRTTQHAWKDEKFVRLILVREPKRSNHSEYSDADARKYRVNTKELYTFKMIQKTNAAYLELHTYSNR